MVNFRFHLVSLVAVFLALGIGIVLGSTVIDQVTVQGLENNIDTLTAQRDTARAQRDALRAELDRWDKLGGELPGELLANRLTGVPVLVVAIDGTDGDVVAAAHDWLRSAGARDEGTLQLKAKLELREAGAAADLAALVGSNASRAEPVRRAAFDALAAALVPPPATTPTTAPAPAAPPPPATTVAGAPPAGLLARLVDAGYLGFDASDGGPPLGAIPAPGTRIVVVSDVGAREHSTRLGVPLVAALAAQPGAQVVVAESGTDDTRAVLTGAVREDDALAAKVSTVDDLDRVYGRIAMVLAVEDLASNTVGHYGLGTDRLLPEPNT